MTSPFSLLSTLCHMIVFGHVLEMIRLDARSGQCPANRSICMRKCPTACFMILKWNCLDQTTCFTWRACPIQQGTAWTWSNFALVAQRAQRCTSTAHRFLVCLHQRTENDRTKKKDRAPRCRWIVDCFWNRYLRLTSIHPALQNEGPNLRLGKVDQILCEGESSLLTTPTCEAV